MSRVAKKPVTIPSGVEINVVENVVQVKGPKGNLNHTLHQLVKFEKTESEIHISVNTESRQAWAQAGTARAIVNNLVQGVSQGFEKKLELVGVGYRGKVQGDSINLTLGFSHPIDHKLPEGVTAEMPTQTEIVLKSIDKQLLGQVAAEIRGYRPPEPYKGKGVKYADERIIRKEAKKK